MSTSQSLRERICCDLFICFLALRALRAEGFTDVVACDMILHAPFLIHILFNATLDNREHNREHDDHNGQ
jgi:hypothetical protein